MKQQSLNARRRLVAGVYWALFVLLTPALTALPEADLKLGMSAQEVVQLLGEPNGTLGLGDRQTLVFDRGRVLLSRGKVASWDFMTPAEEKERAAARKAQLKRLRIRAAQELQRLPDAEGTPRERIERAYALGEHYPELELEPVLAELRDQRVAADRERQRLREAAALEARLQNLETRVVEAEAEARRARFDDDGGRFYLGRRFPFIGHGKGFGRYGPHAPLRPELQENAVPTIRPGFSIGRIPVGRPLQLNSEPRVVGGAEGVRRTVREGRERIFGEDALRR